jgi:hypothetical protein
MMTIAQSFSKEWFMEAPTGQMVGAGIAVVVGLIALYFIINAMKFAVAYRKEIMIAGIVIGGAMWGLNSLLEMEFVGVMIIGFVGMGLVFGLALLKTKG